MSDQSSRDHLSPILPRFGSNFLQDHARLIISNSAIALVELVANSWDAGADRVDITWPDPAPGDFVIRDNGIGMTHEEFMRRWLELSYNRLQEQGAVVTFPRDGHKRTRPAYGRNGKGRHSVFCFANEYTIETWRQGEGSKFIVRRTSGVTNTPFVVERISSYKTPLGESGTIIAAELVRNHLKLSAVRDLIGSKFVADPDFKVYLNNELLELTDLGHIAETQTLSIPGIGLIQIHSIDSQRQTRTSKQHGVAWWVNKRLVGEPSWKGYDEALLDARTSEAKRFTFVVEADVLADSVREDWSDFIATERVKTVQIEVQKHVLKRLHGMMKGTHREQKLTALRANGSSLKSLPQPSQYRVGQFVDELQARLPGIDQRQLNATVGVISKLEQTRTGYRLLEQLATLRPHDIDTLSKILDEWTVQEASAVLEELGWRLNLIARMQKLVEDPTSDELHDIQPLFEQGLWVFGPEYDAISFIANRTLKTVVEKFFKDTLKRPLLSPRNRPDIIALPDSSIGIYASDSFDEETHEVNGIRTVLIVELKRGGFEITMEEKYQAQKYANELRKSGKVQDSTHILAFVLGTQVSIDARNEIKEGNNTIIYPRAYSTILRQAHARTFNLLKKIEQAKQVRLSDPEVEEILNTAGQRNMFSEEE